MTHQLVYLRKGIKITNNSLHNIYIYARSIDANNISEFMNVELKPKFTWTSCFNIHIIFMSNTSYQKYDNCLVTVDSNIEDPIAISKICVPAYEYIIPLVNKYKIYEGLISTITCHRIITKGILPFSTDTFKTVTFSVIEESNSRYKSMLCDFKDELMILFASSNFD